MSVFDRMLPGEWRSQFQGLPPPAHEEASPMARLTAQRNPWRQRLYALASGLAGSSQAQNFGEGLTGGLAGSLQGAETFRMHEEARQERESEKEAKQAQATYQMLQDAIQNKRQQAQLDETMRHNRQDEINAANRQGSQSADESLVNMPPDQFATLLSRKGQLSKVTDRNGPDDSPVIDDQTLNDYADALATSGTFPNLGGFGKYGTKVKLLIGQRASQRHPGLNIAKAAADYKSNQAALSKMTQASAGLESFSETANKNADILLEQVNSIPEFGNRFMNSAARRTAAMFGDQNVARFNTSLETVVPEFARILQSGGQIGGQVLTDTQKKDMRAVLHGDFTRDQLRASIVILQREIANRKVAQQSTMEALQRKITPQGGASVGSPSNDPSDPLGIR